MTVFNSDNHSSDKQNSEQLDKHTLDVLSPETIVLDDDDDLSLVENSPIMVIRWIFLRDSNQIKLKDISQNMTHLGYSSEELLAGEVAWLDLIHLDDISRVHETLNKAIQINSSTYINDYRLKNKFGDYHWIEDHTTIARSPEGHIRYFQSVIVDITERRKVELELSQKSNYFQALHETALAITNHLDLQELTHSLALRLAKLFGCNDVFILAVNKETNMLDPVATIGRFENQRRSFSRGEGMVGKAWEKARAVYVDENPNPGMPQKAPFLINASAMIPLIVSDNVLGVMGLCFDSPKQFDRLTKEYLEKFAQLAAIALDNAQLYKNAELEIKERKEIESELQLELQERQKLEKDLHNKQQALAKQMQFRTDLAELVEESLSGDLSENFYQHILQKAVEIVPGAESGSLLVKQESGKYQFKAAIGYDFEELKQVWLEPHELYRDESEKEPLRLFKLDHDKLDEERNDNIEKTTDDRPILVTLSVPIHIDNKPVALFFLDNFQSQDAFSDDTLHLAKIFTNQVTALWQRYLLEENLQEKEQNYRNLFLTASRDSQELRLLDEVQNTISGQLDLRSLFKSITQKISEIFDYSHTNIATLQDDNFVITATHGYQDDKRPPKVISKEDSNFSVVLKQKKPLLITSDNNVTLLSDLQRDLYQSLVLLPITVNHKLYGIWTVASNKRDLELKDIELLQKIIELLVVAIENAQLHSQVKKELHRSDAMYKISQSVQTSETLGKLMDDIVEEIRSAVGARWTIMYKIDFDKRYIQHISNSNYFANGLPHFTFNQLKEGLTGWTLENKESVFIKKNTVDPREYPEVVEARKGLNVGAFIVVPLIHRGKVMGTLQAINSLDDDDFSEEDVALLNAVASQAGVALAQYDLRQKIVHQAYHDALTGLPNRLLFEESLNNTIERAEKNKEMFATMFLDLDGFKHVNDTLGHEIGDYLLKVVAQRLTSRTRKVDVLARMGGDEFAIILNDVSSKEEALAIGESFLALFKNVFTIEAHIVRVGASIGISFYPDDAVDASTLLRHADSAMYQAKDSGKNSVRYFTPELARKAKERLNLETELRKAIVNGGLELYYQPQICFVQNECIGVEALLRWNHPELGFISPAKFIPIAEESKLILDIGKWVMHEACAQNAKWQVQGHKPITMAVNISAIQFDSPNFIDNVVGALNESSLDPEFLEIEVTESVVMKDMALIIDRLSALRAIGITIAIDDFGTGYSSLQYLQKLPLDKLKIDKAFVDEISGANPDGSSAPIASSILALAQSLNLKTVAEGIETEDQVEFLRMLGCDEAQGYFYAKPMPASDLWNWFAKRQTATDAMFLSKAS